MSKIEIDTDKPNLVSSIIAAKFLNLSDERVRQMTEEGYLVCEKDGRKNKYDLIPTVNTYIEYWKAKAKMIEQNMSDEQRKIKADADWKEAKAAIEGMKRDELKGSLHSSDDVFAVTQDMVMNIRAELLAIPGMCAVDCANAKTPAEASGIIRDAINNILNGLTEYEYNPEKYKKLVRERETWLVGDHEE